MEYKIIIQEMIAKTRTWFENLSYFPRIGLLTSSIILGVCLFFGLAYSGLIILLMGVAFFIIGIRFILRGHRTNDMFEGLGGSTIILISILLLIIYYCA